LKARSFFLKSIGLLLFIGLFIYASPGDVIESLQRADLALLSFAGAFALTGVVVKKGARVRRAIVDKWNVIEEGDTVGHDLDRDRERFSVTESGIVVIPHAPGVIRDW